MLQVREGGVGQPYTGGLSVQGSLHGKEEEEWGGKEESVIH